MSTRKQFGRIGVLVRTFGSAVAAAAAVERGHRPTNQDLVMLGIDPMHFDRIRKY
ncbi:hypothetical protein N7E70_000130 [Aminobacter sp. NyZ550]|jgi:hypothetical protein|uniref:Uncharacterized protein n=2 Tax=Aminobacter TaxID=31988 RepID=A0AAC9APM0_AMIAI|nr:MULTISPECIES: hypothetical protein [Aminobacter]AMS38970.1 hypothetical protein AA2016_0027 [Aminobacter aminovorans]MBA8908347.1 hypothetical protein [Aminobacter ciceronei]MBA9022214.1 hypothetical protein [Aminobacter ciceronei]MBB3708817.1 hypothetical protein [Aminobacter aminovorans]QNH34398.1 hypothetical protein H5P29_00130 [Aminobacter sp. MDW-2]